MKKVEVLHHFILTANGKNVESQTFEDEKTAQRRVNLYNKKSEAGRTPFPGIGKNLKFGYAKIEPRKHTYHLLAI